MKRLSLVSAVALSLVSAGAAPPLLKEADVVVVGGTVDGVRAAVAARAAGASVFLVAPRAYLGEDRAGAFQLARRPDDDVADPVFREIFNPLYAPPKHVKPVETRDAFADDARLVQIADLGASRPISGVQMKVPTQVRQDASFRRDAKDLFATARVVFETSDDGAAWTPYAVVTRADNAYGQRVSDSPFGHRAPVTCRFVRATQVREPDYPRQEKGRLAVLAPVPAGLRATVTPFLLKRGLDKALLAAGVPFLTGFPATDVLRDANGRVAGVVVASRNGFQSVRAKVVVDATLRGRMAERAGAERLPFPAGERPCSFAVVGNTGEIQTRELSLPFADGSQIAFMNAEHLARDRTWWPQQGDAADHVALDMPDRFTRLPAGVFAVGPCAAAGTDPVRTGRAAAEQARRCPPPEGDVRPVRARLPVLAACDVVVAGGGTGGAPAGIGAARKGAKTIVLEFVDRLGGQTTEGRICGYYFGNRVGFTTEIDQGCKATGTVRSAAKAEWFRRAIRAAGGDVWFGAFAAGVRTENGRVTGVIAVLSDGTCGIVACQTAIDATGNSDLAAAAGCETEFITADELCVQGVGQAPQHPGGGGANSDIGFLNDADAEDLSFFALRSRLSLPDSTWDQAQIPGSRERRRLKGAFYVTPSDVLLERTYPDTICRTYSNFDTHGQTRSAQFFIEDPPHGALYVNLPYRALLPKTLDGLLVIGLGMSAHRDAMPVLRMEPDVQNQGYAAGVASAMAVASGRTVRDIDVRGLQRHLVEKGILPGDVLETGDSFPPSDRDFDDAVARLPDGYAGLAVVMSDPARAIPRLKAAWRSAGTPAAKLVYAHVLGMLGDRTGESDLLAKFRDAPWDRGWDFRGMSQFMRSVSWTDSYAIALGRARSLAAIPLLAEKADRLTAESAYSHVRAMALAFESIGDANATPVLARLLRLPGMGGHALAADAPIPPIRNYSNREGDRERTRVLKELCLARAIFNLGDTPDALGRRTLEAYAADPRRAYAAHAALVLKGRARGRETP
ncbi:MAG: FAD-dependent oxidoreductase [Kiritimatiellia bacterium]